MDLIYWLITFVLVFAIVVFRLLLSEKPRDMPSPRRTKEPPKKNPVMDAIYNPKEFRKPR